MLENLGSHSVRRALHDAPEHIADHFDPMTTAYCTIDVITIELLPLDEEPHRP